MKTYKSPNQEHRITFTLEGEIRFGPLFYTLSIDRRVIPDRIFGLGYVWHPASIFIALQEWLTIDYQKGPITALALVDIREWKLARISKADKGFICPLKFESGLIVYEKRYYASGSSRAEEYEIKLADVSNWEQIANKDE